MCFFVELFFLIDFYMKRPLGPTQVKCQLLISSIFYAINFRHFSEMPLIKFQHIQKMSEIH